MSLEGLSDELKEFDASLAHISADRSAGLTLIVNALYKRFGRAPTENEVFGFIMGDDEYRMKIWNYGLPDTKPKGA